VLGDDELMGEILGLHSTEHLATRRAKHHSEKNMKPPQHTLTSSNCHTGLKTTFLLTSAQDTLFNIQQGGLKLTQTDTPSLTLHVWVVCPSFGYHGNQVN